VAYKLMPEVHAVPMAKLKASIVPIGSPQFRPCESQIIMSLTSVRAILL
jgi:hypothetical protein